MATGFLTRQADARRRTVVLVLLYLLSVVAVVLAVGLVIAVILPIMGQDGDRQPIILGMLITAGAIFLMSAVTISVLSEGGETVALMVGARRVAHDTADHLERRFVNVVEEMAIASGVRLPGVYVMDRERGINAFASGWDVSNSIIVVTRGALETLNRDELQAVVGHEFSHILNGDIRLNVRMLGLFDGIAYIGGLGSSMIRDSRGGDGKNADLFVLLPGLVLFVIGYTGLFFARLIKAAVSREREFLADAFSVQLTRNPDGLAGALDQMSVSARGAQIVNRYAEEMAHMYFGQSIHVWLEELFATHPTIEERIARVRPGFAPTRYRSGRAQSRTGDVPARDGSQLPENRAATLGARGNPPDYAGMWNDALVSVAQLGHLETARIDHAARLLGALPEDLRHRLRDPEGARAVILALLLGPRSEIVQIQLGALRNIGLEALGESARDSIAALTGVPPASHFALIDLALPVLKSMAAEARRQILAALEAVVRADRSVSIHSFALLGFVRSQLEHRRPVQKYRSLAAAREPALLVLGLVARAGASRAEAIAAAAFAAGAKVAGLEGADLPARGALELGSVERALAELRGLPLLVKAKFINAMFAVAAHDGVISVAEAELVRLVGAVLDCPIPPLADAIDPSRLRSDREVH